MEEYEAYEDLPNIPTDEEWEAYEKMDGSLGLLFNYENEWIFASRGSFTSEQAVKGYNIFVKMFDGNFHFLDEQYTYIFEIIYPENRIVVNYGKDEDLILLGAIHTESGEEMSYEDMKLLYDDEDEESIFTIVKRYTGIKDFEFMKMIDLENKEGYVVVFESGFRMKIKFEDYCRLHSIVTNVSNKTIWEHLKDGLPFEELLDRVPDEFYSWVEKTKRELEDAYNEIKMECLAEAVNVLAELAKKGDFSKKDYALMVKDHKYSGILFAIYDKKDYSESIWKLVRPVYSKPFKEVVEE
jgi:RNA ligase